MYPNLFLKTFWLPEFRPQIFVAMSFADADKKRFEEVIAPTIESITVNGIQLKPYRVDLSKSGDSILTDIIDGIAHSEMFLADISTVGHDSKTGLAYRNGNVMYEVGLAVACRQAAELLLIRDDRDKFLFDVSTIPHKNIDFTDAISARVELKEALVQRLKERDYINDTRIKIAISTLTADEKVVLESFAKHPPKCGFGFPNSGRINFLAMAAMPRLLDKQLVKTIAIADDGQPVYDWTRLGYEVAKKLNILLPQVKWTQETSVSSREKSLSEAQASFHYQPSFVERK